MSDDPIAIADTLLVALGSAFSTAKVSRPQQMRAYQYGFPPATLEPGETGTVKVDLRDPFRPEKLVMAAQMDEIRGHFKIKRSRLPLLDCDNVVEAHTSLMKRKNGRHFWSGKTTITYRGAWGRGKSMTYAAISRRAKAGSTADKETLVDVDRLVEQGLSLDEAIEKAGRQSREFRPSSVEYIPVDPLEYVTLLNIFCDKERQMPSPGDGTMAMMFGAGVPSNKLPSNKLPLPTTSASISLLLENRGDIQVRVWATMFGRAYA